MPETRILVLSSRDPVAPGADDPPLRDARAGGPQAREDSVAHVAHELIPTLARLPGVRVAHRPIQRPSEILAATAGHRPDLVFNLCEALAGDSRLEVTAAWMLERLGLPFTGSPHAALRACLFKLETNALLARAGVRVPWTVRAHGPDDVRAVAFPAIVKPEREDGSTGIEARSVVHDARALRDQIAWVVDTFRQPAVVQGYVEGRELSVSLLGWPEPRVLPVGEIAFDALPAGHPRILTYASKWLAGTDEHRATPSVAAVLRPHELRKVAAIGRRAFEVLGLRDYGRVDVRLDARGEPFVIDVNPNCDLSPDGGFARAAGRAGIGYAALVWEVLRGAIRRSSDDALHLASRGRSPRRAPVALAAGAAR